LLNVNHYANEGPEGSDIFCSSVDRELADLYILYFKRCGLLCGESTKDRRGEGYV